MTEGIEIVKVDLATDVRLRIKGVIDDQMKDYGIEPGDYSSLELGFEVPEGWPVDKNCEPTLAELVVMANKLDLQIFINSIDLKPLVGSDGLHSVMCRLKETLDSKSSDNEPVYCERCRHCMTAFPFSIPPRCRKTTKLVNNPMGRYYTYKQCAIENIDNNCGNFELKTSLRIINAIKNFLGRFK